jgi:uncharacterized protein
MVAVVSDTHMPKGRRELPGRCLELLADAELIVHAGDFSGETVLDRFESLGPPLVAVHGNVEEPGVVRRLPGRAEFAWNGTRIGVVHDAGPRQGRLGRLRRLFPGTRAVIFGHSHLPLLERDEDGFQIFNPGSPTERRRAPARTMGLIRGDNAAGKLAFELVEL